VKLTFGRLSGVGRIHQPNGHCHVMATSIWTMLEIVQLEPGLKVTFERMELELADDDT